MKYNHVGYFERLPVNVNLTDSTTFTQLNDQFAPVGDVTFGPTSTKNYVLKNQPVGALSFTQSQYSNLGRYNTFIMDDEGVPVQNQDQLLGLGGALNGIGRSSSSGYFFGNRWGQQSNFAVANREQFRLSAQAGAQIKNHTIKVGFEYEQRIGASYATLVNPYLTMPNFLNRHLDRVPSVVSTCESIVGGDTTVFITTGYEVLRDNDGTPNGQSSLIEHIEINLIYL